MTAGAWLCLLAPLAGALAITLLGGSISRRTAAWISTLSVFTAFVGAIVSFVGLLGRDHEEREVVTTAYTWLATPNFRVDLSLLVDPLSVTMMLIVSGVGGLIVLYSVGYMDGDPEERRYFAYMSLFVFSMLMLVQAGNFLLLLVGWGLVGLASYLLDRLLARAARSGRGGEEGVRDERVRRRDDGARVLRPDVADRDAELPRRPSRAPPGSRRPRSTSSRSACSAARSPSRPRSRSTPGCPTRWRARRPSRR